MNEQDFELLVESIKQAGEIKRGERQPSRVFEFSPLDVKAIRARLDQSQSLRESSGRCWSKSSRARKSRAGR